MLKRFKLFLKKLYKKYKIDHLDSLGSQIAYSALFSIFPLLILLLALLALTPVTSDQFLIDIKRFLPDQIYELVKSIVAYNHQSGNKLQLISIGTIVTIFSASRGMVAVTVGLNKAYRVRETRNLFKVQGMAIFFTLLLAILIIVMLLGLAFGDIISLKIISKTSKPEHWNTLWNIIRYFLIQVFMFVVLEMLYVFVPNKRLRFREVIIGCLTVIVFSNLFTLVYSFYINRFVGYSKIYGSIGAIMILLLWIYYNCILVLIGGEINSIMYKRSICKR